MGFPPAGDGHADECVEIYQGGAPTLAKTLHLELLVSEDERRRLKDQIFLLEGHLAEATRRIELYRAEANMNSQGLRRFEEEKEVMQSGCEKLASRRAKLERECILYEGDIARLMESCDDLARENEDLKLQSIKASSISELANEVNSLRKDKENLRTNLHRAEEEVKVLFIENTILDDENKRLLKELSKGCHDLGSGGKHSVGSVAKGKRKSSPTESLSHQKADESTNADPGRQPLSPLQHNPPATRMRKE